jgi:hypothetical protein
MGANITIWAPKAQYGRQQHNIGRQQLMSFCGNLPKSHEIGKKFVKNYVKRVKIPYCPLDFSNSDSYRTIGSPM